MDCLKVLVSITLLISSWTREVEVRVRGTPAFFMNYSNLAIFLGPGYLCLLSNDLSFMFLTSRSPTSSLARIIYSYTRKCASFR